MKRTNIDIIIASFLVLIVVSGRVLNAKLGMPNFMPIAAVSLFSAAIIKDRRALALLVPILGQFLADVYFQFFTHTPGFYDLAGQSFNYVAILSAGLLGLTMKQPKALNVLGYTVGASLIFFAVSNLGYYAGGWNGYGISGFTKTYIDAIPFYKNSFASDIVGGVVLFGGYFLAQQSLIGKSQKAKA
jgi:hypothetical protein